MAQFEPRTFPDFFQRMLNRVVARTQLTDLEVGGVLTTLVGAVARELDDISYQIVALQDLWDIDTATGPDLDARAADCNPDEIERKGSVRASGTVTFGRTDTSSSVTVPASTLVAVVGGEPVYKTSTDVTLGIGVATSPSVGVIAVVAGTSGNIDAGTLIPLTGIAEIVVNVAGVNTVINDTSCTGGQDQESDQELRERIKSYLRSLSRATPDALKFAVLGAAVTGYGRIVVAEVEELPTPNYGQVIVWVDDGNGTTAVVDNNIGSRETVIAVAIGGEVRLMLDHIALDSAILPIVVWKDHHDYAGGGVDAEHTLTEGVAGDPITSYDYSLNYATGKITLNPGGPNSIPDAATSTDGVAGLQSGDALYAEYGWFLGLIEEAQRIIDGDPSDRENYPGYRAAGVYVRAQAPVVFWQNVEAVLVMDPGYDATAVLAAATGAVEQYINSLSINGDVIFSELMHAVQSIDGVFDVTFVVPDQFSPDPNVLIGDGELARTSTAYISLTGA